MFRLADMLQINEEPCISSSAHQIRLGNSQNHFAFYLLVDALISNTIIIRSCLNKQLIVG